LDAQKTANASEPDQVAMTLKPFGNSELYIANEAYSTQLGWSEGSLVSAENLLLDYFGAHPASWQRNVTAADVRFGAGYEDFQDVLQMSMYPTEYSHLSRSHCRMSLHDSP
jgi:hypothetical protein